MGQIEAGEKKKGVCVKTILEKLKACQLQKGLVAWEQVGGEGFFSF